VSVLATVDAGGLVMMLKEFMQTPVFACAPTATLAMAAHEMAAHNVGALLVTDDDERIVGIVTDRDIALAIGNGHPGDTTVDEIDTHDVVTIEEDADVLGAARLMSTNGVRRLPVADPSGRAVGMVSLDDLFGYVANETSALSRATRAHGSARL
jgi:CBS domain-containing protein